MANSIQHQYFYPHPPEVVWEYLTKAELVSQWLMETDILPIFGYDFQFRVKPIPDLDFDGIIYCKMLEVVPFKKLSYSWKLGPGEGRITVDSIVVWTLVEKNNGTELQLVHSGFEDMENFKIYTSMEVGWLKNMQKMAERINSAKHGTTNA